MTLRSTVHRRHDRPNPRRIGFDPAVLVRRGVLAQEDAGPLEGHGAPGGPAPADVDFAHTGLPHDPRGVTLVDPASREDGDPPRRLLHPPRYLRDPRLRRLGLARGEHPVRSEE